MSDIADADDFERISRLRALYFAFVDAKNWRGLADLFSPDATIEMPRYDGPRPYLDAIASFRSALAGVESVHIGYMPDITIDSDTYAHARWGMEDSLYRRIPGCPGYYALLNGFGYYDDTYVRDREAWRFQSIRLTRVREDLFPRVRR